MRRLFAFLAALGAIACARAQEQETMAELRDRVFDVAKVQAVYMDSLLSDLSFRAEPQAEPLSFRAEPQAESRNLYPRTYQDGQLVTSDIGWWCSGFYPGVLWEIYDHGHGKDKDIREMAVRRTRPLKALLDRDTDHDIGFQLMSSYGHWKCFKKEGLESPEEIAEIDRVLQTGAQKLAARYTPKIGAIRSWNGDRWNYPVIIDNMMNLELLMEYGDEIVAEKHALTTLKNHFRPDGTTWHLVDYADDGSVLGKQTVQGFSNDSAWARGQAWALYGYAMMGFWSMASADLYTETARNLARWIIDNLPEDGIPYWDFSRTDYKDASAAAIIAAGLLRLVEVLDVIYDDPVDPDDPLLRTAERILRTLASPEYLAEPHTNGGFLLKHGVGNLPGGSEVDVPLTYADYYFLEALNWFPLEVSNGSD